MPIKKQPTHKTEYYTDTILDTAYTNGKVFISTIKDDSPYKSKTNLKAVRRQEEKNFYDNVKETNDLDIQRNSYQIESKLQSYNLSLNDYQFHKDNLYEHAVKNSLELFKNPLAYLKKLGENLKRVYKDLQEIKLKRNEYKQEIAVKRYLELVLQRSKIDVEVNKLKSTNSLFSGHSRLHLHRSDQDDSITDSQATNYRNSLSDHYRNKSNIQVQINHQFAILKAMGVKVETKDKTLGRSVKSIYATDAYKAAQREYDKKRLLEIKKFVTDKNITFKSLGLEDSSVDDIKKDLRLVWAAWKDGAFAELTYGTDDYKFHRAKKASKDDRRITHAGLLMILMTIVNEAHPLDQINNPEELITHFNDFIDEFKNIEDEEDKKELSERFRFAQNAVEHFHNYIDEHYHADKFDKVVSIIYSVISGMYKGIAAIILCITFFSLPPAWMSVPLIAIGVAIINLKFWDFEVFDNNKNSIIFSSTGLLLTTIAFFAFPAAPWFYLSMGFLIGGIAGCQSYQMTFQVFQRFKREDQIKDDSNPFNFLTKKKINGEPVNLNPRELTFASVGLVFSILNQGIWQFIIYHLFMHFIDTAPFLTGLAAWPLTPYAVFGLIFVMQSISMIQNFRFVKSKFIMLANLDADTVRSYVNNIMNTVVTAYQKNGFLMFTFKSAFASLLTFNAVFYTAIGAKISAISILNFFAISATGSPLLVMIAMTGLSISVIQPFYSTVNATRFFNVINQFIFGEPLATLPDIFKQKVTIDNPDANKNILMRTLNQLKRLVGKAPKGELSFKGDDDLNMIYQVMKKVDVLLLYIKSWVETLIIALNSFGKAGMKISPNNSWQTNVQGSAAETANSVQSGLLGKSAEKPVREYLKGALIVKSLFANSDGANDLKDEHKQVVEMKCRRG